MEAYRKKTRTPVAATTTAPAWAMVILAAPVRQTPEGGEASSLPLPRGRETLGLCTAALALPSPAPHRPDPPPPRESLLRTENRASAPAHPHTRSHLAGRPREAYACLTTVPPGSGRPGRTRRRKAPRLPDKLGPTAVTPRPSRPAPTCGRGPAPGGSGASAARRPLMTSGNRCPAPARPPQPKNGVY